MTDLEMLQAIKSQTLATLAEMTAAPKPTYAIDGQSVAWADYLSRLTATVEWCNRQLAADETFEIRSQGYSA